VTASRDGSLELALVHLRAALDAQALGLTVELLFCTFMSDCHLILLWAFRRGYPRKCVFKRVFGGVCAVSSRNAPLGDRDLPGARIASLLSDARAEVIDGLDARRDPLPTKVITQVLRA
jgi:hypothetical protein